MLGTVFFVCLNLWYSNHLKNFNLHYGTPTMNQAVCDVVEIPKE